MLLSPFYKTNIRLFKKNGTKLQNKVQSYKMLRYKIAIILLSFNKVNKSTNEIVTINRRYKLYIDTA